MIRPRGEAASFVAALRDFCQEVDPAALCEPKTVRELAAFQRFPFLAASIVASSLGTLALVLTSIGLYGIVAFAVVQRFREIGVRMALGSTPMEVLRLMVGRAARSVLIGFAVGLPVCVVLAWGASRLFRTLNSFDPVVLLCVPLLLAVVTVVAALIPARRATLVSPWLSLRAD